MSVFHSILHFIYTERCSGTKCKWVLCGNTAKNLSHACVSCRIIIDAFQQGRSGRLVATIAYRASRWDFCTITESSEEGSMEITWFKVKKKKVGITRELQTSWDMDNCKDASVSLHNKTISVRILGCVFELGEGSELCVLKLYSCPYSLWSIN